MTPDPPAEPVDLKAHWRATAEADPAGMRAALADPAPLVEWMWARWGPELETDGADEGSLARAATALDREVWLWVMGERQWAELAALLYGRSVRLARQRPGATSTKG
ncbi:MAG TPA: hypothetical protein VGR90_01185 [Acidimicrobiales bacterium]|nr:hypothetical protein [Acidimicrobiales bacterium]